jgi:hypothetical protein
MKKKIQQNSELSMLKRFFIARCIGGEMTEKSTQFKIGHSAVIHPTLFRDFLTFFFKLANFSHLLKRKMTLQKVKIQAKDSRVFNYIYLAVYLREK